MKHRIINFAKPLVDRFPSIARAYRQIRDSNGLRGSAVTTPLGFRFLGNRVMQEGRFEPQETQIVSSLLAKVDTVVDVGANMGYYCCLARSYGSKVIAFEPIWLNAQYLLRNIEANNWQDGVELFVLAASDRVGTAKIFGGGTGASLVAGWAGISPNYVTYVPTSTLDTVLGTRLSGARVLFIVDVEGAEDKVLAGSKIQLNLKPSPIWMVEIIPSQKNGIGANPNYRSTFEVFWSSGYEAWTATVPPRAVSARQVEELAAGGRDTIGSPNIIFVRTGEGSQLL